MKKILLTITGFVVTLLALAQSPNLMNYQGVARNAAGNVLPSQPVGLRLSILSGSPTGTVVYQETRNVTTNAFGLFNVQVGSPGAITTTGTIAGINWTAFGVGSGTKYLQVEIDPIGGTSYFNVGSTQLVSVPYALNAGAAAPVGPAGGDLTGTYPNPTVAKLQGRPVAATAPANLNLLMWDAGTVSWIPATAVQAGIVSGTGTLNTVAKWTPNGTTIGNSQIFDNGTNVGINTIAPIEKFQVNPAGPGGISVGTNSAAGGFTAMFLGISQQSGGYGRIQAIRSSGSAFGDIVMNEAGGNVGIQTNAPQHKLSVGPTTADAQAVMVRGFGGGPVNWKGGAAFGNTNATVIMGETGGVAQLGGHNSNLTAWADLAINSGGGNVGIGGTTAPQHKLSVGSTTTDAQTVQVRGFGGTNPNWKGSAAFGNTNATVIMGELGAVAQIGGHNSNLTAWADLAINAGGGNVGIGGTIAPQHKLSVGPTTADAQTVQVRGFGGTNPNWKGAAAFGNTNATVIMGENANVATIGGNNLNLSAWQPFAINPAPGYNVGIGTFTPTYALDVNHNGATGIRSRSLAGFSVVDIDAADGDEALRFLNNGAGDWHIGGGLYGGLNFLDMKTGQNRMLLQNVTGNVGIGTNAPNARLDVLNATNANAGNFVNSNAAATAASLRTISASSAFAAPGLNAISVSASSYGGVVASVYGNSFNNQALLGASDNNIGVHGASNFSHGVVGETYAGSSTVGVWGLGYGANYGVVGQAGAGIGGYFSGGLRALLTQGAVQLRGIGEAAGRVLTSDAAGNATWQENTSQSVGISAHFLTGTETIPTYSGTHTPITKWTNLLEDGGANYNPPTGEYTITKAGVYQVNASIVYQPFTAAASNASVGLKINNTMQHQNLVTNIAVGSEANPNLAIAQRFNVGDVLQVAVFQNSGATQTIGAGYYATNFSVQFLHK